MRIEDVRRQLTTPLGAPAYPPARYRFTDREYLNITYRTDPDAMRAVVPEPLTVAEPLVRFEVMRMPDTTGLGSFSESGQVLHVEYEGEPADYLHAMYVDSLASIASGREISAYPKKLGAPRLYTDSDTLVGTLDYGTLRVATATMGYKHRRLDEPTPAPRSGAPPSGSRCCRPRTAAGTASSSWSAARSPT
jgi:acetoacetate decarboxylase